MDEEKRIFPRFSFSKPVAYAQSNITAGGSVAGNISLGGIALRVQEFIPLGTVLEMQINLTPGPQVTWSRAEVVRIREVLADDCYEIGLKFIKDEGCLKAVGEYIDTYRSNGKQGV